MELLEVVEYFLKYLVIVPVQYIENQLSGCQPNTILRLGEMGEVVTLLGKSLPPMQFSRTKIQVVCLLTDTICSHTKKFSCFQGEIVRVDELLVVFNVKGRVSFHFPKIFSEFPGGS